MFLTAVRRALLYPKDTTIVVRSISSQNLSNSYKNVVQSKLLNVIVPNAFLDDYIWEKTEKWSDRIAVICSETRRQYLYSDILRKSRALCNFLHKKVPNIRENDTVSIILPNIPEYPIIVLGVIQAGLKITLANPNYTSDEILYQLLTSGTKFVFTMNQVWSQVSLAIQKSNLSIPVAIVKHKQAESIPLKTINFNEMVEGDTNSAISVVRCQNDAALLPYSSGTTGLPKAVELTHRNIVSNLFQINTPPFKLLKDAEGSFQEVVPLLLPVFHIYGMVVALLNGLQSGCKLIAIPKFQPASFINMLETFHPSVAYFVSPTVSFLANDNAVRAEHISTLRAIVSAAAPLNPKDIFQLQEKSGCALTLQQVYGLSEAITITYFRSDKIKQSDNTCGVGFAVPNTEFVIRSMDGNNREGLEPNTIGELFVRGPQVMKRYHNNLSATQAAIDENGWLETGDIAHYDENDELHISGRVKELIKVRGFQVAPAELEEILRNYPGINDAAVVGVPHAFYGEQPKAFVVAEKNSKLDIQEVEKYVASKVAYYKQLKGGIVIVDNIPKNVAGKILRKQLRQL